MYKALKLDDLRSKLGDKQIEKIVNNFLLKKLKNNKEILKKEKIKVVINFD